MKRTTTLFQARYLSLFLLVGALLEHATLNVDFTGSTPSSSGLVRFSRDLNRRANGASSYRLEASARRLRLAQDEVFEI
jgi:hypothetical protein